MIRPWHTVTIDIQRLLTNNSDKLQIAIYSQGHIIYIYIHYGWFPLILTDIDCTFIALKKLIGLKYTCPFYRFPHPLSRFRTFTTLRSCRLLHPPSLFFWLVKIFWMSLPPFKTMVAYVPVNNKNMMLISFFSIIQAELSLVALYILSKYIQCT